MRHVDEGALHAYLDGALDEYPAAEARRVREHLETCTECSERLAGERRVREEAQDILGLAAPSVEVPSFEELRAYVRTQAPRRAAASALYRLGWAASVVLALGTGWLLRGGVAPTVMRPGEAVLRPTGTTAVAPPADAEPAAAASVELEERSNERVVEPVGRAAPQGSASAATGAQEPAAFADGARAAGTGASAPPPAPPAAPTELQVAARRQVERAAVDAGASRAPDREPPATLADALDLEQAAAKAADDAPDVSAAAPRRAAPASSPASVLPAPAPAPVTADAAGPDTARRDAAVTQRGAAEQRLTSAITAQSPVSGAVGGANALGRGAVDDVDQAPADEAEAEPVSLVVPGLEVLDVLPVGQGTTFAGMRALQRLQSGDTLELVHLPEAIDPASLPPLSAGWSQIVRPRGSGWLVMRAPLSEAALAELLQRLESGR